MIIGCDQAQPTVYKIPKEERAVTVNVKPEKATALSTDASKMQILPGMQETADSAPEISYEVPTGWVALAPSGIRKVNLKVDSNGESAEVTVLTFPGDVGGTLANINRWREQVGLKPAVPESIDGFSEPLTIANHPALYVRLKGAEKSILGAILPFHGNTWFFKMLGDTSVVLANDNAMKEFLGSIAFPEHAH